MSKNSFFGKTADIFNRGFFIFYFALFVLTAVAGLITVAVFGELGREYPMPVIIVVLRFLALILSFAAVAALFIALSRYLLSEKGARFEERKTNTRLIFIGVGVILAIQLLFAFTFEQER